MASTSYKRKCLKLSEKVKIIEEVALGAGVTQLAKKYGVSKATICKMKRMKTQILQRTCNTFGGPGNRKTLKNAKAPKMENSLYKWFLKQQGNHVPVSGEILKERARLLNEKLKETDNFVASDGWLQRFKTRYGIRLLSISGEKLSAQPQLLKIENPNIVCTPTDINFRNEDKQTNDANTEEDMDTSYKRKCLKLSDKVKIIEEVALGAGVTQLAKKYGVSKATICKMKRMKTQILQRTCNTFGGTGNRKTLKNAKAPKMENSLYEWFLKQRGNHVPVSGEILKERARLLNEELKETDNFTASDGWLQRFKTRYGIRLLSISSEKLSEPQLLKIVNPNIVCTPTDINFWNKDKQTNDANTEEDMDSEDDHNIVCTPTDIIFWNEDKQTNDANTEADMNSEDDPLEVSCVVTDAQAVQVFNQALDWAERKEVSYTDILVLRKLRAQALEDNAKLKFTQTKILNYFSSN